MPVTTWYEDGYLWRHPDPEWDKKFYGVDTKGKGDIIYNTMARILDQEDKSDWAIQALYQCAKLLNIWRRWPIEDDQDVDARTAIGWRFNQLARWLYLTKKVKYRYRHSITRDPYIAFYCCSLFLDHPHFLEQLPIPIWLFSLNTWRWRRKLIKDNRKMFVQRLDHYRSMATMIKTFDNPDIQQNISDA